MRRTTFWFAAAALVGLLLADLDIVNANPWTEFARMGQGLLHPEVSSWGELLEWTAKTLAFAVEGMTLAIALGMLLALLYRHWWIRALCAFLRAIHELFWALLFIQCLGLSPLSGVLALAIPYAGTLAKIYGELFDETDPLPRSTLLQPNGLSAFLFTTLPLAWKPLLTYTSYRLECALRSSIVLGFIGLPTLGYHLESTLREGYYAQAAALLYTLILMVIALKYALQKFLLPIYVLLAFWYLPPVAEVKPEFILRFFTQDIVPAPLQGGWQADTGSRLWQWLQLLWQQQMWPGLANTLIISQIALVSTAVLALLAFPLNSPHFTGRASRILGDSLLVVLRTIPEYLLAFVVLLFVGPSMLPAIIALTLHNGAILAHLLGGFSAEICLRADACRGINRYAYEILPRLYRHFLALLLYRWEVIMRESAILGILGIATLGFYVDSAFEEFRLDRAALLILTSALLNIGIDNLARHLRRRLHLSTTPETL
ncbi:ABC transporter permease [Pseudomaricurvus alcaniphilus]|nr:ABC transporter permease [Pseudomaricurvus alcaniphilus]